MLFRMKMICMEGDYFSLVNIRLKLENYRFSKSLRRIFRKSQGQFRTVIRPATINSEKERLYQQQKPRFKGFVFDTLSDFLYFDYYIDLFDTYEVCVYDQDKLIAVSFFDMGKRSVASLIGLFDLDPSYNKYSLGIYTMLAEVDYALAAGKKYYYPGYILDRASEFDYKLRLGKYEYYNWKGRWRPYDKFGEESMGSDLIRQKLDQIKANLQVQGIPFRQRLYPFFSIGYLDAFEEEMFKSIVFLQLFPDKDIPNFVIEYRLEDDTFVLSSVASREFEDEFMETSLTEEYTNDSRYHLELMAYDQHYFSHPDPWQMAQRVRMSQQYFERLQ